MKEKITGNYKRILAIVMSILMIFGICSVRQDVLAATGNLYTDINAASFNIYIDQETTNTTLLGLLGKYVDHTGSCVTPSNISCQDPDDIIADAPFVAPNWTIVLTGKVGNATIRMDASTNQCGVYGTQTANGATMHVVVDYSPACKFIQTYLGGHWNGVPASKTYEGTFTTSAGNEELIYSGMDAWNRLTPTEQAEVNAAVKAANPENDSYEDLLAKAFQEKQDQAKDSIDAAAQAKKDAIDALENLTEMEKTAKKEEIDDAVNKAKKAIEDADNSADVGKAKQEGLADLELTVEKAKAIDAIRAEMEEKKAEVDALENLTGEEKAAKKKAIEDARKEAKAAIDNATDIATVNNAKENGIVTMGLLADKAEAIDAIHADAKEKKDAIDALENLTEEEKEIKKSEIDRAKESTVDAIEKAATVEEVAEEKNAGLETIELTVEKAKAIDAITAKKAETIEYIKTLPHLSDADKEECISMIEEATEDLLRGADSIESAATKEDILDKVDSYMVYTDNMMQIADMADFMAGYLSDEEENIYTSVNSGNVDQILSGQDRWAEFSPEQQEEINELIKQETNGIYETYEEYLEASKAFVEDQKNNFIKDYVTGEDGKIYTVLDSSNYEQILSGKADWDKMSKAEQDAINEALVAAGSKAYPELIKEAEELQKSADGFVEKYLTDKGGNIYKTATKDNYQQILSGKADWDKLSQNEKDAINAKLKANGGKTYEELLKLAEAIKKQVEAEGTAKTGDPAATSVYVLVALISLMGAAVVAEKKRRYL